MPTQTRSQAAPFSILGDALESAAESLEQAAANAPESARRAAQTTRRALGMGLYKVCYGLSFGVVYSAVFLAELMPEESVVRRGFREGAEAARQSRARRLKANPASSLAPAATALRAANGTRQRAANTARKPRSAARRAQPRPATAA